MKKFLALIVLLGALLAHSHAACYIKSPLYMHDNSRPFCQDDVDKTWHPFGSRWRNSKCYDCDCMECCTAYATPRNVSPDCVSVFVPERCEYVVHKKNDPSVPCLDYSAVGK